jgi:tyrosinase
MSCRIECQFNSDDLGSTHINYTLNSHYSGLFLPWHRHFLWLFEKALREECGYKGYLP